MSCKRVNLQCECLPVLFTMEHIDITALPVGNQISNGNLTWIFKLFWCCLLLHLSCCFTGAKRVGLMFTFNWLSFIKADTDWRVQRDGQWNGWAEAACTLTNNTRIISTLSKSERPRWQTHPSIWDVTAAFQHIRWCHLELQTCAMEPFKHL